MIVKYVNEHGEWNYIDGINTVRVCNDTDTKYSNPPEGVDLMPEDIVGVIEHIDTRKSNLESLKTICIIQGEKTSAIVTSEVVYLMNDKGQTIERLV
jgi:hypothetical protein